jgi:hypothetical protein
MSLAGEVFTPTDLAKLFQSQLDSADAITPAKGTYKRTVQAYRDLSKRISAVVMGFKQYLWNLYGNNAEALAVFGLEPRKVAKPKAATKAGAVSKSKATRLARGTKGKKQRKATTGTSAVPVKAAQ